VRRASSTHERTGIQLLPINTVFELAAMAAEGDPALAAAEVLLLIPDLFHHWLCGSRTTEFTNATTTQCLDSAAGEWATDLLERLEIPTSLFPDVVAAGTPLGEVDMGAGLGKAVVIAVATHDTGSAVAACLQASGLDLPQRRHVVARRCRGREAADQRRHVRGEPDERGRGGRDLPTAPQRDGPLASGRVPPLLGGGRP
jgi:hypothetical protein